MSNLTALLPSLYSTAQESERWTGVLDQLCASFGTRNAVVQLLERDGDMLRPSFTARDSFSLKHAALHDLHVNNEQNPRFDFRCMHPVSKIIVRDRDEFDLSDPAYVSLRSRLAMIGLGTSICAMFEIAPGRIFSMLLHRGYENQAEFDDCDEAALNELVPHLRQVTEISHSLHLAKNSAKSLEDAVDMVRMGLVICDGAGRVSWLNHSAEAMIASSGQLRLRNNCLVATNPTGVVALRRLLMASPGIGPQPVTTLERDGATLQIRVTPVGRDIDPGWHRSESLRALYITDSIASLDISADDVASLFSLSPAEARLATAIARGASLASYSIERGISVGTARIQLKQVLAKTQAGKQSGLMRQLCGSVAAQTMPRLN